MRSGRSGTRLPAVSERALIILAAPDESFDHEGISPQLGTIPELVPWDSGGSLGRIGSERCCSRKPSRVRRRRQYRSTTTCFLRESL